MDFVKVDKKVYGYFVSWANKHVEGIHSESIMVADRVVIKNKDKETIAYVYVAYGDTYYIRKDFYTKFTTLKEFRD